MEHPATRKENRVAALRAWAMPHIVTHDPETPRPAIAWPVALAMGFAAGVIVCGLVWAMGPGCALPRQTGGDVLWPDSAALTRYIIRERIGGVQ
jgi:hypothetical protein